MDHIQLHSDSVTPFQDSPGSTRRRSNDFAAILDRYFIYSSLQGFVGLCVQLLVHSFDSALPVEASNFSLRDSTREGYTFVSSLPIWKGTFFYQLCSEREPIHCSYHYRELSYDSTVFPISQPKRPTDSIGSDTVWSVCLFCYYLEMYPNADWFNYLSSHKSRSVHLPVSIADIVRTEV